MSFTFSTYEIAELAQEAEEHSAELYRQMARRTKNEMIQTLFLMLAEQEEDHKTAFEKLAAQYRQNAELHEHVIDLRSILKRNIETMHAHNQALRTNSQDLPLEDACEFARQIETRAVETYELIRSSISTEFHGTINTIIKLEKAHLQQVLDLHQKLKIQGLL